MTTEQMASEIEKLKKEKNAVIMAHYYVYDEVQDAADFVGDSFFLSRKATEIDADIIVLCGVRFMGESAKVLNPDKKVLIPEYAADCPMAHMATVESIAAMREQYDDLAVVCYVNSTAELKAASDVCVTSANALKIVSRLLAVGLLVGLLAVALIGNDVQDGEHVGHIGLAVKVHVARQRSDGQRVGSRNGLAVGGLFARGRNLHFASLLHRDNACIGIDSCDRRIAGTVGHRTVVDAYGEFVLRHFIENHHLQ